MKQSASNTFRVGVDIGGTFTDIVFLSKEGQILTRKVLSTPADYSRAIVDGLQHVFAEAGIGGSDIAEVVHGCTVATNAILEHSGAVTGLITTKGFRDVLEIRRFRMPVLYDFHWEKPPPLVTREFRLEVDERLDYQGNVLRPLDVEGAKAVIHRLVSKGVESIAVCLLHSYANPAHERKIRDLINREYPHVMVSLSSEIIPMVKEYERTTEAVVNAYVRNVVTHYLNSLVDTLHSIEVKAPLLVMQSSGGMMSAEAAMEKPVYIIECGPAAGVVGCHYLAKRLGIPNVLTLDMGGTTTKASIIEDYELSHAPAYEVGAGISMASLLTTGGGYVIRVPSIDIAEIGAGGGSKLWLDVGGALHAGPRSAGAIPGPVCYDLGGQEPTLTDANLVLGYLNPEYLTGGTVRLNAARAYKAIGEQVARPLRLDATEAAYGGHIIANANMIRAIRAVSTLRGRDPRDFILFAFGGAGPIHAAALAREMEIKRVIVTPTPGLFSSFGLLFAEIEHHEVATFFRRLDDSLVAAANQEWDRLRKRAIDEIKVDGYGDVKVIVEKAVDARYAGQSSELRMSIPWDPLKLEHVPTLVERFHEEHLKTYAHKRADEPIDIVNLRLVARVASSAELLTEGIKPAKGAGLAIRGAKERQAYFGKEYAWLNTPILTMEELSDKPRKGPAIIELYDSTCVVPPYCEVSLGSWGTIVMDIKG